MLRVGTLLRQRYRIDALVGEGGMGEVFAATDVRTGQRVALKTVRRGGEASFLLPRLRREAEAVKRIDSPRVPLLYEVDVTEDRELFLVLELLQGQPLSRRLRREKVLPWDDVRRIGEHVLEGLVAAHRAGVVHRDLKPSNVFLEADGARILDFGMAQVEDLGERLTGAGETVGTAAYMAPEQIDGKTAVGEAADLYAFGVLVFEAVTGRLPHEAPEPLALMRRKLDDPPRRLRDVVQVPVPDGLDALVNRCLAREPNRRIRSASELLDEWRKLGAPPLPASPKGPASGAPAAGFHWPLLAVAAVALVLSVALLLSVRSRSRPRPPPSVADAAAAR